MRRQPNGRKRIVSNTTPTSAPTGQNANQRVAPLLAAIDLRDYFAAKAMQIMWDAYDKGYCGLNNQDEPNVTTIAQGAYQMADAMLKARGQA